MKKVSVRYRDLRGVFLYMARIVFISLYDEFAPGVRTLVATLKRAGHFSSLICFKSYSQTPLEEVGELYEGMHIEVLPTGDHINSYSYPASPREDQILIDLLSQLKPDLVGISLTYSQQVAAARISSMIREKLGLPVMWGGPHPTTGPEKCIQHADYVCRGEAEDVILDVAERIDKNESYTDVPNIWAKKADGEIIKNTERLQREDLDSLPFPDYDKESTFFIDQDELRCGEPFPWSDLNTNYIVMTARGCPFACTYCYQSYLKTLYPGQKFVRERSIDNVMEELKQAKERMGHFYLEILDNVFTLKESRVRKFCEKYHREVDEPFWCYTHPKCCRENVIRPLSESPNFEYIIMGIESASTNIGKNIFHRQQTPQDILDAARVLNKYDIRVNYDLITNVPGETEDDCRQNLDLLRKLPKPFRIRLSKLSLFPNYEVQEETRGHSRLVTEKRYRVWNALYFLAQDMDMTDEEVESVLNSPFFEENPEFLEKIAALFDSRWEDLTTLKIKNKLKSVEIESRKKEEERLKSRYDRMMGRRGIRQFLWLHDKAGKIKRAVKKESTAL